MMQGKEIIGKAAILGLCFLTACTVGPKYQPPTAQAPAAFKESPTQFKENGPWTVAQPQDAQLRGNWWEIFRDAELNDLEQQLNINNQTIKEYFQNFMEARAMVREARSQYFPTIGTTPSVTRQRSPSLSGGYTTAVGATTTGATTTTGAVATPGAQTSFYSLPVDISWAPDIWGKVRNEVRNAQYSAQVSAADLENERLTEQAALAEYFFELHGQDALMRLYAATIAADKKTLDLTRALYETGQDDQLSVIEAQNTLQAAQASATNLGILRAQYEHAIAVLIGKAPENFEIASRPLTTAPPQIPIGVPSLLLQRRPDIAAAERTMAAANAEIGVEMAAYYPSLTLSAGGGTEGTAIRNLVEWPSRFWSVGASLSEEIYEGGLRRATINQYVATYNADLASYRQTVLTAFQQVEDYLAETRIYSKEIEQEKEVVASAENAVNLELARYETGLDPYLDVVTLQATLLADQQTLASLQISQMVGAVELVQALGGGWDTSQLPTPAQITAKPAAAETKIQH